MESQPDTDSKSTETNHEIKQTTIKHSSNHSEHGTNADQGATPPEETRVITEWNRECVPVIKYSQHYASKNPQKKSR